jgi:hypothetical protein
MAYVIQSKSELLDLKRLPIITKDKNGKNIEIIRA